MRILAISDLHCTPRGIPPVCDLPRADAIVVAGDVTMRGEREEIRAWGRWVEGAMRVTGAREMRWIRGNHDAWLRASDPALRAIGGPLGVCEIPERQVIVIGGLRVWASSASAWIPEPRRRDVSAARLRTWHAWAWASERREIWAEIPEDLDLLITHTPPSGVLDRTEEGVLAGDPELAQALASLARPPRWHVFGHIHEGRGRTVAPWGSISINASARDRAYRPYPAQGELPEIVVAEKS